MRITRLYLLNSTHIKSGTKLDEINLDLSVNNNIINILVGKMGSGKTTILGHLQPYSTFGTLDVRNQASVIIPGKNGMKIIEYQMNDNYYIIQHEYTWNDRTSTHATKSYIQCNGEELNPNGNTGTFKGLIKSIFGIEQNFLRILRLGPNVANLLQMKSSERKAYAITLLQDTDIYNFIYKKMTDDLRLTNSSLTLLSNKLVQLSADDLENFENQLTAKSESLEMITAEIDQLKEKRTQIQTSIEMLLNFKSPSEVRNDISNLEAHLRSLITARDPLADRLRDMQGDVSLDELNRIIGSLSEQQRTLERAELLTSTQIKDLEVEYRQLSEKIELCANQEQLDELVKHAAEMEQRRDDYKSKLSNFHSSYTYNYISSLVNELSSMNLLIDEVRGNTIQTIGKMFHSDSSIGTYARKKIEMLRGKKYNMQQRMTNLSYTVGYQVPKGLYRPPLCPSSSCPYYKSHPAQLKQSPSMTEIELHNLEDMITKIDAEISMYESYPFLYQKVSALRNAWKNVVTPLSTLKAINCTDLYKVLTNLQNFEWYDYNALIRVMEKCKMQEEYLNLELQIKSITQEITSLQSGQVEDLQRAVEINRNAYDTAYTMLNQTMSDKANTIARLKNAESQYQDYLNQAQLQTEYDKCVVDIELAQQQIDTLLNNLDTVSSYDSERSRISMKLISSEATVQELTNAIGSLRLRLSEISYARDEYQEINRKRTILKNITRAVSPKEGIPLVMVKVFLDSCKDILNDLIADVFADSLEILDFDTTGDEFKIPYSFNGEYIEDIEMASQGQQTIISIALSFAMIRQNIFDYNIMLLDEVDGALYPKDREKFISILFKQLSEIGAHQVFLISHSNPFDNTPANIITTSDDYVDNSPIHHVISLVA